jgi:hypothetical protein
LASLLEIHQAACAVKEKGSAGDLTEGATAVDTAEAGGDVGGQTQANDQVCSELGL